ncbi:MAG: hypothetical protein ACFFA7_12420 [Promethearchaeota archaeon]
MRQKISDIYVPIDFSDLKSVIPPGEDIIYSTLCKGRATVMSKWDARKNITTTWVTHVLFTENGVAWVKPNYWKKKKPSTQEYNSLVDIDYVFYDKVPSFRISPARIFLAREVNFETKEKFVERCEEFLLKFAPLIVQKKEEWLQQNENNPEIREKYKKRVSKHITKMNNQLRDEMVKRERKAAKMAAKAAKKAAKGK